MRRSRSMPPVRNRDAHASGGKVHEDLLRRRGYESHGGRTLSKGAFGSLRACVRLADGEVVAVKTIVQPTRRFALERRVLEVAACLLYTSPSPRDKRQSRMPSSA